MDGGAESLNYFTRIESFLVAEFNLLFKYRQNIEINLFFVQYIKYRVRCSALKPTLIYAGFRDFPLFIRGNTDRPFFIITQVISVYLILRS